jgi:hypothetical protein
MNRGSSSPEAPHGGFWFRSVIFSFLLAACLCTLTVTPSQPIVDEPAEKKDDPPPVKQPEQVPVKQPEQVPVKQPEQVPVKQQPGPVKQPGPVQQPPAKAPTPEVLYTPDSSVQFALGDLLTIPPEERYKYRYLSLYNVPKAKRALYGQSISFIVNSLGTRRRVYIPVFVGGSDETVIRINIEDYEWRAEDWDKLGQKGSGPRAQPEPYFHVLLVKDQVEKEEVVERVKKTRNKYVGQDQYGRAVYRDEEYYEDKKSFKEKKGAKKAVTIRAPWLDPRSILELEKQAGTEFPILRGDWFVSFASIPPAYYDFLRLGNKQQDFINLIFADEEKAAQARSQDKAVVITSTVARNNRTLTRSPTLTGGYYWVSHDSLNSVDDRQYVLNLLNEKFDATEDIGSLPNGLQAYFLTDGKGKRLDFANPDVAIDNSAIDRVVRTGRSCIVCHADGLRPIDDEVRTLTKKLQNKEQVALLVTKKKDAYRIADLFSSDLDKQLARDTQLYADAVAACNGLGTAKNAKQFGQVYDDYVEVLMTKEIVARDVALTVPELEKYIRLSTDPVVLGLTRNPIRPVRRDQWERSFQGMMLLITATKQVQPR